MSTVVSTPVLAWVAALIAGAGVQYSSSIYASVNLTSGWEAQIPVWMKFSACSADSVVSFYPSSDGGVTYDTQAMSSFAVPLVSSAAQQVSVRIPIGQYMMRIANNAHQSASVQVLTQQVVTAVQNV